MSDLKNDPKVLSVAQSVIELISNECDCQEMEDAVLDVLSSYGTSNAYQND